MTVKSNAGLSEAKRRQLCNTGLIQQNSGESYLN